MTLMASWVGSFIAFAASDDAGLGDPEDALLHPVDELLEPPWKLRQFSTVEGRDLDQLAQQVAAPGPCR